MASGQTRILTGVVTNVLSNSPLPNVKVKVVGVDSSCHTNGIGEYRLVLPDTLSHVRFEEFEGMYLLEANRVGEGQINLFMSTSFMSELSMDELMKVKVTTAGKQEQQLVDVPASMVVITRKDIERAGYRDLNEVLENIPGFYSLGNAYNEGGTNFGVRGFSSGGALSDFMILVNGVSQIQDFSNSFSTDKIILPVEAIDRIEVVRGPNAVIYGSNAFMGAINLITNEGGKPNNSFVSAGVGSAESYRAVAHIEGKKEGLQVSFNGVVARTRGLDVSYAAMQSDPTVIQSWGLPADARTGGQLGGLQRCFELSSKYKGFTFMLLHANNDQGTMGSKPSANRSQGFRLNTISNTGYVGYEKVLGARMTLNGRFSYYNYNQEGDPHFNYAHSYNYFATKTDGFDLEVSTMYRPTKHTDILVGINNRSVLGAKRLIDVSTSTVPFRNFGYGLAEGHRILVNSVFTQWSIRPVRKALLVLGLRAEKTNPFGIEAFHDYTVNAVANKDTTVLNSVGTTAYDAWQWIPRVAAIYQINKAQVLKFMFGQSRKRPSILEDVNLAARSLYGLDFAQMQTWELNYSIQFKNSQFSLNAFYNDLDKLVIRNVVVGSTGLITTQAANAGKMKAWGLEGNAKWQPLDRWSLDASVVYQTTKNETKNYPSTSSYSPPFLGYLQVSYVLPKVVLGVYATYVDAMKPGWNILSDPNRSEWYGQSVDSYVKLNLNLRLDPLWKSVFASFHVTNLLDQAIHYPTTPNSTWTDLGMLGFGRFGQVNIGCKF